MSVIKIGGQEIALKFTMRALCRMEDVVGEQIDLETISDKLRSWLKNPRTLMKIAALLADEGETAQGRTFGKDSEWFVDNTSPSDLGDLVRSVSVAIAEGMGMETGQPDEDEEVDLVLEEIKKKATPAKQLTGE